MALVGFVSTSPANVMHPSHWCGKIPLDANMTGGYKLQLGGCSGSRSTHELSFDNNNENDYSTTNVKLNGIPVTTGKLYLLKYALGDIRMEVKASDTTVQLEVYTTAFTLQDKYEELVMYSLSLGRIGYFTINGTSIDCDTAKLSKWS